MSLTKIEQLVKEAGSPIGWVTAAQLLLKELGELARLAETIDRTGNYFHENEDVYALRKALHRVKEFLK